MMTTAGHTTNTLPIAGEDPDSQDFTTSQWFILNDKSPCRDMRSNGRPITILLP